MEKEQLTLHSEVKPQKSLTVVQRVQAAAKSHSGLLVVCLGTLCLLLVVIFIILIYILVVEKKQEGTISDLADKNQLLIAEKAILENRTEQLIEQVKMLESHNKVLKKERDDFNWTLDVILTFNSFPVDELCPNKRCRPCLSDWIVLQDKCYLFYNEGAPWKTWEESRDFCIKMNSDLVVVDSLLEQEFICNHTEFYYDAFHGYWMGLKKVNKTWMWIDGHNDTLGYWMGKSNKTSHSYGLLIPERNPPNSWSPAESWFENKFICERKALFRSNE